MTEETKNDQSDEIAKIRQAFRNKEYAGLIHWLITMYRSGYYAPGICEKIGLLSQVAELEGKYCQIPNHQRPTANPLTLEEFQRKWLISTSDQ